MKNKITKGSKAVKIALTSEEHKSLERFSERYFTNRISTIVRNIVRDEMKSFEEKNKDGVYIEFFEEPENTEDVLVYLDAYTFEFVSRYSKKLDVPVSWFTKYLIRPQLKSAMEKEK